MRYRPLDNQGDYTVGVPFLYNSPQCVAQAISTVLKLWQGEWFLDITVGTPWNQSILGKSMNPDAYIKKAILSTQGVTSLQSYSSSFNGATRQLNVTGVANTLYGQATINSSVPIGVVF